ncbi:MAG: thioredoxin-dependent thiol peroxidase [Flavobacteriaceae bacterium]|nr:MAG: thioredoxin-dependent thiol peroxidase [Flavobacteriaceae bacterium]
MLNLGDKVEEFEGFNQDGRKVKLSDYLDKNLILFFYPKASTPGCTLEACNLSEHFEDFQKKGYNVLGVSADSVERQKKFKEKFNLSYDLIADVDKKIIDQFGVFGEKQFMGKTHMGIYRTTFVISKQSVITQRIDKVKTKEHHSQIQIE